MPRTSPLFSAKLSALSPDRVCTSFNSSEGSGRDGGFGFGGNTTSMDLPIISRTTSSSFTSRVGHVPTFLPFLNTVRRWHRSRISPIRWEMYTTATPSLLSRVTRLKSHSTSFMPRAEVGSSRTRIRAFL